MPYFDNDGIKLYYEIAGSGPPLLLINGLGGDTRSWAFLNEYLIGSFTVISYDMRCAGKSDKPRTSFTIDDLADEARSLILALGHKNVSVLGFSMGGFISMRLALMHPALVHKMYLVASAPSFRRPYPVSADNIEMLNRTDVSPELLTQVYERIFGSKYRGRVSAELFIKFRMEDDEPQPADAYLNQLRACELFDVCEEVGQIKADTAIIVGREDALIPPENSRWLHDKIAGSKLFELEGVGHMVPLEAPERLAEIITS